MKRLGLIVVLGVACLAAVYWFRPQPEREAPATEKACLDALFDACSSGDVSAYLHCLDQPLQAEVRRKFPDDQTLAVQLQQYAQGIQSRVYLPAPGGAHDWRVDEVRVSGTRRWTIRLKRSRGGWCVRAMENPQQVPTVIPYGTHIGESSQ